MRCRGGFPYHTASTSEPCRVRGRSHNGPHAHSAPFFLEKNSNRMAYLKSVNALDVTTYRVDYKLSREIHRSKLFTFRVFRYFHEKKIQRRLMKNGSASKPVTLLINNEDYCESARYVHLLITLPTQA